MTAAVRSLASLALAVVVLLLASAQARAAVRHVRLDDVKRGSLLLPTLEPGTFREVPTLGTVVDFHVTGLVVRAEVTQRFETPAEDTAEAVYAFPLPDGAAVDRLRVKIGERVIEGEIRERADARRTYEKAKREGRKASLVEQHRPNLFTNALANLPAGVLVEVTLGYQEVLRYDDGEVRLSFPTAVTRRYTPPFATGPNGTVPAAVMKQVGPHGAGHLTARVHVDAGFPLSSVQSPSHELRAVYDGEERFHVTVTDVPADRDLVVQWRATPSTKPRARLLYETFGGEQYALLLVTPPAVFPQDAPAVPREVTFVIDTSGSMHGESMVQAKGALALAVERLHERDRFNVVEFNSTTRALYPEPVPASASNRAHAAHFVSGLRADGGTEMLAALDVALKQRTQSFEGMRQIVFITDGAVSNEAALFDRIKAGLGDGRLFTVGIGAAPNGHFMRKAAEFGRGTFTYIANTNEVAAKMGSLFSKVERPALTDLEVSFGAAVEMYPPRLPDLYAGEPVVVVAKARELGREATVRGAQGTQRFEAKVSLAGGDARGALHKLWARRKVEALTDASATYGSDDKRPEIVATALRHGIVTQHTSLVAVERSEVASLQVNEQGSLPRGGTPALLCLLLGAGLLGVGGAGARRKRR